MTEDAKVTCLMPFSSGDIDKISSALAAAQGEIAKVVKGETAKGASFSYTYATLDAVMEAVKAVQAKHGLALIQRPDGLNLNTILAHSSGQWIDYGNYPLGQAAKHQERGSALTYARRYTTCAIFGIAPEQDDDGKHGNDALGKGDAMTRRYAPAVRGEVKEVHSKLSSEYNDAESTDIIDTEQAAELDLLIRETKSDKKAVLAYFRVEDVRHIKLVDYERAYKMLEKKKGAM